MKGNHYKYELYMLFNPKLKERDHSRDESNQSDRSALPDEITCATITGHLGMKSISSTVVQQSINLNFFDIPMLNELHSYNKLPNRLGA